MKSMAIAVVLAGGLWAADAEADRAGVEKTIHALSASPMWSGLFTSDFDETELLRFAKAPVADGGAIPVTVNGAAGTLVISKEPMGEATWLPAWMHAPMVIKKIRFLTADVAMADAVGKSPVLIVLKKVGTDWKIASLRILAD
jgi:hypothetical protein